MNQIQQEFNAYITGLIGAGFNAETYKEYGVNAAQVTHIAKLICWHARANGSAAAALDQIGSTIVGHPMDGLMSYTLNGKDVAAFVWLDAIASLLSARFDELFSE